MADQRTVNIHGKEYETVASRVQRFRKEHGTKYAIITELIEATDQRVVMKASILGSDRQLAGVVAYATGYAEESRTSSQINKTSALENAETSAIGRALANFGMAGTEYASADEVAQAIGQQAKEPSKPLSSSDKLITPAQAGMLLGRAKHASGLTTREEVLEFYRAETGTELTSTKQKDLARIQAIFGDVEVE